MFGHKRDEIIGGWRKLRSEELHNLYSSLNMYNQNDLIKGDEMRRACSNNGEYRVFVENSY
jgi:hypothetical protein